MENHPSYAQANFIISNCEHRYLKPTLPVAGKTELLQPWFLQSRAKLQPIPHDLPQCFMSETTGL